VAAHFTMLGVEKVRTTMLNIAQAMPDKVKKALYKEAQIEMTEAKKRCPVAPDGGTLRASGIVLPPEHEGKRISVTMSFGGGGAEAYALAVHEHLSEFSPPSWQPPTIVQWNAAGTGPKFLESVMLEALPHMGDRISESLDVEKK